MSHKVGLVSDVTYKDPRDGASLTRDTIAKVLKSMGLTEKETDVYIFIAQHGVIRGGEIARGIKTHRTEVYRVLKSLQSKGLVLATLEAPTRFKVSPFEDVLDSFIKAKRDEAARVEETKKDLLTDWKYLKRKVPEPEVETFVVIEGKQKIYAKILQMVKDTKAGFSAFLPLPSLLRVDDLGLFEHIPKSTIQARFLTELADKSLVSIKTLGRRLGKSGFSVRTRNPEIGLQLSPSMVIRDAKDLLFFVAPRKDLLSPQEDVVLWTNCRELVNSFVVIFEDLWRNSVEIEDQVLESARGRQTLKALTFTDEQTVKKKYDEAMKAAKEEILVVTSSEGFGKLSENEKMLKEIAARGVSTKILAPITAENLKAAMKLSEWCDIRHAPPGWLATTIFDSQRLFQFKIASPTLQAETRQFESVFYSEDAAYVGATRKILHNLWKNSRALSNAPLDSIMESFARGDDPYRSKLLGKVIDEKPAGAITEKDVLDKIFSGKKYQTTRGFKDIVRYYGSASMGVVYPPPNFRLPDLLFNVVHCNKQSSFGAEDWILISMRLETTGGNKYVPVVHVTDNPKAARARRPIFTGVPGSTSIQIMKEHELQVHVQGNSLFAGWTAPISLPTLNSAIPPAGLLFEGCGDIKSGAVTRISERGRKQEVVYNRMEAFLTFFHPASKYSGPGIDAFFDREIIFTSYPPSK